jgi:7,8-dihydropterin-6-yl-methyl-4-(beta-D-ribofuranosyl)aminobenzene 5'-phosphate synthase
MFKKLFNKLKISILVENWVCWAKVKWEWGLSMFVEYDWKNILWDTGQTDIFLENAKQMKVNLDKTDFIVLSHFHYDHTWWIKMTNFANNKKIIAHPRVFKEIWDEIKGNYEKIESSWFYKITENIYFLWEIKRTTIFEKWAYWKDKMLDDTALVVKTKKGLVILAWCSHSWIINICEYAKQITWEQKIYWVIWGFHLLQMWWIDQASEEQITKTIDYFKENNVEKLFPMHCVDFAILSRMQQELNIKKLYTWDKVEF